VQSTGNSKRDRLETSDDDECSKDSELYRTLKLSRIEDITDLVWKRLNQTGQQFLKGMERSGLRLSDSSLSEEIITLFFRGSL